MAQIGGIFYEDDGEKVLGFGMLAALNAVALVSIIRIFGPLIW